MKITLLPSFQNRETKLQFKIYQAEYPQISQNSSTLQVINFNKTKVLRENSLDHNLKILEQKRMGGGQLA